MEKLTPLMQQYWTIKSAHKDQLVFFRMGDFYELFHDDARIAAPILNIALTSRNKKNADETAMCGVPHHSVAGPINRLLRAGFRVAICDQIEDPTAAKGIVKRAVTRILSPGMVYDPNILDGTKPNYICSFDEASLSFLDATTGEAFYYLLEKDRSQAQVQRLIEVLRPIEIIVTVGAKAEYAAMPFLSGILITEFDMSSRKDSREILLDYAQFMQGPDVLKSLRPFEQRSLSSCLELSSTVVRHLEIFETYNGDEKGSLFSCIDRTKTSSGARLLKSWLRFPLVDKNKIQERLQKVEEWKLKPQELKFLRDLLGGMGDMERKLGKIANPSCNPRDLLSLASSLEIASEILKQKFPIGQKLTAAIVDEPPISVAKGGVIRRGYNPDLDQLIKLTDESEKCLLEIEAKEKENTGISSLKVRFNNVFGYYIEVTKTHLNKIPQNYIRRQTLAGAERFITEELQNLEAKILSARGKRLELEAQIFAELRAMVMGQMGDLSRVAQVISELDVVTSLAWLALERNYVRPEIGEKGELKLMGSRHPVVEQSTGRVFIANDITMKLGDGLMLTGPNMAGKSTLMRQVAVSVLLAQIGSFVPAKSAEIPVFEKIFTRIGASDSLSQGLSTFMVEMAETAEMIKSANAKSLVILDEIGRGTSTYDGLSLAQAILEHLLDKSSAMIFFATHYHELTKLEDEFPQIRNFHMAISEEKGEMKFLYLLQKGPASKSYGIEVAKLAGIPQSVTQRARQLLKDLQLGTNAQLTLSHLDLQPVSDPIVEEIKSLNIQHMTPLEALNKLSQWQQSYN